MYRICILGCAVAISVMAQSAFEAATVKVSTAQDTRSRMRGGPATDDPGQITYTNVTLASVLQRAFDLKSYQISAPDWVNSRRYDITAKIPAGASPRQFRAMLQDLLRDRFRLELHRENRALPGYELVTGRNGPKLKPAAAGTEPKLELMESVKGKSVVTALTAHAQPLSALTDRISREFRMPILDKTNLDGLYDFQIEFAPQSPGAMPRPPVPDGSVEAPDDSAANLTTAVQQQLGLRLIPAKVATDFLVIDRGDPVPTGN
jgi:uncharacterized protein (TIGR03435 family)